MSEMSGNPQPNSVVNAAINAIAEAKVHYALWEDIQQFTPEIVNHFRRGGIRQGPGRTQTEMQQLFDQIPPSHRAGVDGKSAAYKVKEYLSGKDASHIKPHSAGGSSHPDNIRWEDKLPNRDRGNSPMSRSEQANLAVKAQFDNLTGALKAGAAAAPKGAAIGAVTTVPFALLKNSLKVIRGEISAQEAALLTVQETAVGGGAGAASAFVVTTVATACPPIAIGLTAISPVLLVVGGAGMVYEFFKILEDHKAEVKNYHASLTQDQLQHLAQIEENLIYEHSKTMAFLAHAEQTSAEIIGRSRDPGVEGALKRYVESLQIKASLSASSPLSKATQSSNQGFLLPDGEQ